MPMRSRNNRSSYSYEIRDGVVCIIDHDCGKSVTNDAEYVIADLVGDGVAVNELPVIYRDTDGMWDQLLIKDRSFAAFKCIRELCVEDAIAAAKATAGLAPSP